MNVTLNELSLIFDSFILVETQDWKKVQKIRIQQKYRLFNKSLILKQNMT